MNRLKRIDMCTVVPYEYMSVSDVLNGLIYLILSSSTRADAVNSSGSAVAVVGSVSPLVSLVLFLLRRFGTVSLLRRDMRLGREK